MCVQWMGNTCQRTSDIDAVTRDTIIFRFISRDDAVINQKNKHSQNPNRTSINVVPAVNNSNIIVSIQSDCWRFVVMPAADMPHTGTVGLDNCFGYFITWRWTGIFALGHGHQDVLLCQLYDIKPVRESAKFSDRNGTNLLFWLPLSANMQVFNAHRAIVVNYKQVLIRQVDPHNLGSFEGAQIYIIGRNTNCRY
jgi:hypothetical protein